MATLLEKYANRLALSEKVYSDRNQGKKMDGYKKLFIAKCLENTNR